ncbi:MAG: hypothetical protein NZ551_02255 [Microscillaceae bacterium]|nr:hypothetical protein [Microscillaceae bacterium]MDW8460008.1 hypothetical protein [Cytophagales bacterium]
MSHLYRVLCLTIALLTGSHAFIFAQNINFPRNFRDIFGVGCSLGYSYSDASGYNRWARWQNMSEGTSHYIPISFDLYAANPDGNYTSLEYYNHILTNGQKPTPNHNSLVLKRGYNVRSWGNIHLIPCLGVGLQTNRINFKRIIPPSLVGLGFSNKAYARRTAMVLNPEINLLINQLGSKKEMIVGIRTGTTLSFLQGNWRYGESTEDGFDSEIVQGLPETMRESFYVKLYLGFQVSLSK